MTSVRFVKKRLGGGFGERSEPKKFFGSTPPDLPDIALGNPPSPTLLNGRRFRVLFIIRCVDVGRVRYTKQFDTTIQFN